MKFLLHELLITTFDEKRIKKAKLSLFNYCATRRGDKVDTTITVIERKIIKMRVRYLCTKCHKHTRAARVENKTN